MSTETTAVAKTDTRIDLLTRARQHLPLAAASWNEAEDRTTADFHVAAVLRLIKEIDAELASPALPPGEEEGRKGAALLPCPFCHDPGPEEAQSAVPNTKGGHKRAVYCNGCFCEGPTAETTEAAIAAWNRRAAPGAAAAALPWYEVSRSLVRCEGIPPEHVVAWLYTREDHSPSQIILRERWANVDKLVWSEVALVPAARAAQAQGGAA